MRRARAGVEQGRGVSGEGEEDFVEHAGAGCTAGYGSVVVLHEPPDKGDEQAQQFKATAHGSCSAMRAWWGDAVGLVRWGRVAAWGLPLLQGTRPITRPARLSHEAAPRSLPYSERERLD
jgi:hypothetical protein